MKKLFKLIAALCFVAPVRHEGASTCEHVHILNKQMHNPNTIACDNSTHLRLAALLAFNCSFNALLIK